MVACCCYEAEQKLLPQGNFINVLTLKLQTDFNGYVFGV